MFVSQYQRTIGIDNSFVVGSGNLGGVHHRRFCRMARAGFYLHRPALHFPPVDVRNARNTNLAPHSRSRR